MTKDNLEVRQLVCKIVFDIWEANHNAMMLAMEGDDTPITHHPRNSRQSKANNIKDHMNLVAISTAVTPPRAT